MGKGETDYVVRYNSIERTFDTWLRVVKFLSSIKIGAVKGELSITKVRRK